MALLLIKRHPTRQLHALASSAALIKIRATHEIVTVRAAEFAFLVVQFVAAARAPAPVFAEGLLANEFTFRWGLRFGTRGLFKRHAGDFLTKRLPQTSSPFTGACGNFARDDSLV
jgi:hypothetical protein